MENLSQRWTQSGTFFSKFDFQKRAWGAFVLTPSSAPVNVAEYASLFRNMPKYPGKCFNKPCWLCQVSEYVRSPYMFEKHLKMPQVLNVSWFWIWHGYICNGYTDFWICLNMAQYALIMHQCSSLCLHVP